MSSSALGDYRAGVVEDLDAIRHVPGTPAQPAERIKGNAPKLRVQPGHSLGEHAVTLPGDAPDEEFAAGAGWNTSPGAPVQIGMYPRWSRPSAPRARPERITITLLA